MLTDCAKSKLCSGVQTLIHVANVSEPRTLGMLDAGHLSAVYMMGDSNATWTHICVLRTWCKKYIKIKISRCVIHYRQSKYPIVSVHVNEVLYIDHKFL